MSTPGFISEDDLLRTFEDWLRYQQIDPRTTTNELLAILRRQYDEACAERAAQAKIGLMKLGPLATGERRYAVAVRDEGGALWLTLWVRCSPKGEIFVMVPRGGEGWNPHTSYHRDGTVHMKTHNMKLMCRQLQPLMAFCGAAHLGSYNGHAPKSEGAVCDPAAFNGIIEVPTGRLGPRHGGITAVREHCVHSACRPPRRPAPLILVPKRPFDMHTVGFGSLHCSLV